MFEGLVYHARADAERAMVVANSESPFTITVRFVGGLTQPQMDAFAAAADRWVTVIVGDLPDVSIDGEVIDDVLVVAAGADIDGVGHVLGQARITHRRRPSAEPWAMLPARGEMTFDKADLAAMESAGTLGDVITHEMGHVLGVGGLWAPKGLLADGTGPDDPRFIGAAAVAEYRKLNGGNDLVPVENTGGAGTARVHWREHDLGNELMTGFVNRAPNSLSRITAASLGDLGYQVDIDAADHYELPPTKRRIDLAHRVPCHDMHISAEAPTTV